MIPDCFNSPALRSIVQRMETAAGREITFEAWRDIEGCCSRFERDRSYQTHFSIDGDMDRRAVMVKEWEKDRKAIDRLRRYMLDGTDEGHALDEVAFMIDALEREANSVDRRTDDARESLIDGLVQVFCDLTGRELSALSAGSNGYDEMNEETAFLKAALELAGQPASRSTARNKIKAIGDWARANDGFPRGMVPYWKLGTTTL